MRMSIIIPVNNGAQTLDRCLQSIIDQTFSDYQVILVDDGSTDATLTIAQGWADRDSRFNVISEPCHGPGAARNRALSLALGEYILYMDADDYWVRSDLLQELESRIQNKAADVYMYQMIKVTEEGSVLQRFTKPPFTSADQVLPLGDVYQDLVRDGHTLAAVWNKCVRRQLLLDKEIRFREDVFGEDIDWVLQLFCHAQTICLLNIRAYAYTQHRTVSRSTHSDGPNDLVTIVVDWAERIARGGISHHDSVAGVIAFEYGICMGNYHRLSGEKKRQIRSNTHLLHWGLDRKTMLIRRFYRIFGFQLTCIALRLFLFARRIW